jgi:hypothetical protein
MPAGSCRSPSVASGAFKIRDLTWIVERTFAIKIAATKLMLDRLTTA